MSERDRGSILVMTLAVVTALGVVTAVTIDTARTVLHRERSAWSAVVAWADTRSVEIWALAELWREPDITCAELMARSPPELGQGTHITVTCSGGPPEPWSVTVSAINGPRTVIAAVTVSSGDAGSLTVHTRSMVAGPKPALTNAA